MVEEGEIELQKEDKKEVADNKDDKKWNIYILKLSLNQESILYILSI